MKKYMKGVNGVYSVASGMHSRELHGITHFIIMAQLQHNRP